jgi:hypothetical protein
MPVPEIIEQLVERYHDNYEAYHHVEYNGKQSRVGDGGAADRGGGV